MSGTENFARVHIDRVDSAAAKSAAENPVAASGSPSDSRSEFTSGYPDQERKKFWQRPFSIFGGRGERQNELRAELAPTGEESYRMIPVAELLDKLKITHHGSGYLEDDAMTALDVRLRRLGLTLATSITGPLRIRITDRVPVIDADTPQVSRHSAITVSLYLIAWMLQADSVTTRDSALVDRWIENYDPKEKWGETAKGTFRWLMSRKLILTYKRKQRTGRLKRYPNVRNKLLDLLLRLVSNPQTATPRRMARLKTIYETLDLDPQTIHSDLHRLSTNGKRAPADRTEPGHKIPKLDTALLREMEKSTRKAQQVLSEVFTADEETRSGAEQKISVTPQVEEKSLLVKESRELQMLRELVKKEEWSKQETEEMARKQGLTLGAFLEILNDLSYNICDESCIDDEMDYISVSQDIVNQCIDCLEKTNCITP